MKKGSKDLMYRKMLTRNYLAILEDTRVGFMTYRQIADKCDLSVGSVFNVFKGKMLNPATVLQIAAVLGIPSEEIIR